jgi:hypothetical protein
MFYVTAVVRKTDPVDFYFTCYVRFSVCALLPFKYSNPSFSPFSGFISCLICCTSTCDSQQTSHSFIQLKGTLQLSWLNQGCSSAFLAVILLSGSRFVIWLTKSLSSGCTKSQDVKGCLRSPGVKLPASSSRRKKKSFSFPICVRSRFRLS